MTNGLMMGEALFDLGKMGAEDVKEAKSWNRVTVTERFIVTAGYRAEGQVLRGSVAERSRFS